MKSRLFGSLKLLVLLVANGCEPATAAPAPLSDNEAEELPEEDEEQDEPSEASTSRPRSDASVILNRDAGRDASVDAASEPLDGSSGGDPDAGTSSNPGSDAAVQRRDAASNVATDASTTTFDAALAPREAGAPIVLAPPPTGIRAVDGPVEWIVDRCRNLSPDRVYFRATIQRVELGAIYDFDSLDQPCQTETAVQPVITGLGTVLIANVNAANIGVATSGIRAPEGHYTNALTTWSYTWIDANNSGHQLRLPLTQALCPSPLLFAVPNTSRFFVDCASRVYDEQGQSFSIGDAQILAVGLDGLILAYTNDQPAKLAYYTRGTRTGSFDVASDLTVKAARASGAGFLLVLGSPNLFVPPVPDRLYFMDASGARELRGAYPAYGDHYLTYVGPMGRSSQAALDATGVLYDLRTRFFVAAFSTLFKLWNVDLTSDTKRPCMQAEERGLHCLYQRGTLDQVRTLGRPVILTLRDGNSNPHQVVLAALGPRSAALDIGGTSYRVANSDLEQLWFGEYLLLWRPGTSGVKTFLPGMRDPDVRWLRASLARIQGKPVNPMDSDLFDENLAARVRDYQRDRRLPIDGMAGHATQVAISSDLGDGDMPRLAQAN